MKKEIKIVDAQGRVTLGREWARSVVVIEDSDGVIITIRKQKTEDANPELDDFLGGE